ncbi:MULTISPECIES: glycosyltransferase family 2 protein [unclassified Leisingera]|uniref:glycosyltransferase family 2 protein n=1 Tax=unclassified Leisingera TaxID=2614906 RepID=UPI0002FFAE9F|nr:MULTISPECIES: glycosyltransferase family 2 protein [unclassified Leisingera]
MTLLFWVCAGMICFSLAGYGLLWCLLAAVFGRRAPLPPEQPLKATVLIAARNEEAAIRAKLETVLAQDCGPHRVDVLVVSDGSEDATLQQALSLGSPRIRAFQTPEHGGKAQALTAGLARIDADVVVFSDANSMLSPDALRHLLAPFSRPDTGGVCGRLRPKHRKGRGGWLARAERLFWVYDSALKAAESRLGGAVSAQGTLYAMRRKLVPERVPGDVADDFFISVQAPAQHRRLVFEPRAVAQEAVTSRTGEEFMRRVRSTERGWRGLMRMRRLMNPGKYGLYALQLLLHKGLRRIVAFLLPLLLVLSLAAATAHGGIYTAVLLMQMVIYGVAAGSLLWPLLARLPGSGLCRFFVLGHAAMGFGILRAMAGVHSVRWAPARRVADE